MTKERPGEREAFEGWAQSEDVSLRRDHDGNEYRSFTTRDMWSAWLARAALSARAGTDGGDGASDPWRFCSEDLDALKETIRQQFVRNYHGYDRTIDNLADRAEWAVAPIVEAAKRLALNMDRASDYRAAPTRARQDALEEAARVVEALDELAVVADWDNGDDIASEVKRRCASAIRALSPADGGGRG